MTSVKRQKLTNSSNETPISHLLSGDHVFAIPFFQRSYKWKLPRLFQLNDDIMKIVDETDDFHFLGAIIIHGRSHNPSDPQVFEVIDGQQRITTLFLYIAAVVRLLTELGEVSEAAGLFLKYLTIGRETNLPSNIKLHPCKEDRAQLNYVITDLIKPKIFKEKLAGFVPKLLPISGAPQGILRNNYMASYRFLKSHVEHGGVEMLRKINEKLLNSVTVVQIDVYDPTDGPKIYDSLNSHQEPMTIGDLVRNEIFSKVANEHPDDIDQIDQHHWLPFYKKFQQNTRNLFDSYFFPYGLICDSNLKKSEVYGALRERWQNTKDPKLIIKELEQYQTAFIDIACGQNKQNHPKEIAQLFRNLYLSNAPTSTYPFLMQMSQALKGDKVSVSDIRDSLELIESFLTRRAVCGHEPTGLHAVFKRLWNDCAANFSKDTVEKEIAKHKTVVRPTSDDFMKAIRSRPLYGVGVTNYVLREYDRSLGGDQPDNPSWIEHVLPVHPVDDWYDDFPKEEHQATVGLLANLIPLTKEMNVSLSNKAYALKRKHYEDDSMYKSAREFAKLHKTWTPKALKDRAEKLAVWAVNRWKY